MRQKSKSVAPQPIVGTRQVISTWFVFLPPNIDREKFVEHSLRTNTISLRNEYGEAHHNVPVSKLAMPLIQFPLSTEDGSNVLACNVSYRNQLYVFDVLFNANEFQFQDENEYLIDQSTDNNTSQVSVNSDTGSVTVSSISKDGKAKVNLKSQEINLKASKSLNTLSEQLVSKIEELLTVTLSEPSTDENKVQIKSDRQNFEISLSEGDTQKVLIKFNASDETAQIKPNKKVIIGDGSEPVLLGDKSESFINELLGALKTIKCGPYPLAPDVVAKITQLEQKVEPLKSTYHFTD